MSASRTNLTTTSLTRTEAFRAVSRKGRWVHSPSLSVGALPNGLAVTRVGIRTRRGIKGAVVRNRLKRQLRAVVYGTPLPLRTGVDLVIVIHPATPRVSTDLFSNELMSLCKRNGTLAASLH